MSIEWKENKKSPRADQLAFDYDGELNAMMEKTGLPKERLTPKADGKWYVDGKTDVDTWLALAAEYDAQHEGEH